MHILITFFSPENFHLIMLQKCYLKQISFDENEHDQTSD